MRTILFLDTCILLDLYGRGGPSADLSNLRPADPSNLRHIDENHERIVTTAQVAMEFSKNRQGVLANLFKGANPKGTGLGGLPGVLNVKAPQGAMAAVDRHAKRVSDRILKFLSCPGRYDPIFQTVRRLTRARTALNLHSGHKGLPDIEIRAWARFVRGCPPRKSGDLSMGDAINWEWMLACAHEPQSHLVIVSRDSDYGITHGKRTFPNDYLSNEFTSRVGRGSRLTLTPHLAAGFDAAGIKLTKSEKRAAKDASDQLAAQRATLQSHPPIFTLTEEYGWPPPYLPRDYSTVGYYPSMRRNNPLFIRDNPNTPLPMQEG